MMALLMDLGLSVEQSLILEDELSRLPKRTQRVFELRAMGYPQQLIADDIGISQQAVSMHVRKLIFPISQVVKPPKTRPYTNRGSNAN